ncbi:MAG: hypothetical protein HRU41_10705 [Saprospiraceae bacterium]|nr:hypothetical protein [Saprospiraceae bacterium]
MSKLNWKTYAFEFLSIFVAVISAFALTNWDDKRRDRHTEVKILTEIRNGLEKDIKDVQLNLLGHNAGIKACQFVRRMATGKAVGKDSFPSYYFNLTRDFISIQNSSGYESLKSNGLGTIRNDSLRLQIIDIYEYDFRNMEKLEEDYKEMQYHASYFHPINDILSPYFIFSEEGQVQIAVPLDLSPKAEQLLLSYLWKIEENRKFVQRFYGDIENKIQRVIDAIEEEIQN